MNLVTEKQLQGNDLLGALKSSLNLPRTALVLLLTVSHPESLLPTETPFLIILVSSLQGLNPFPLYCETSSLDQKIPGMIVPAEGV